MIGRRFSLGDIAPRELANFQQSCRGIEGSRPQAVLWHEDGLPRRLWVDGEEVGPGGVLVRDARETARLIYERYASRVHRAVVTDFEGYQRLVTATNLVPRENEARLAYLERTFSALHSQFDSRAAIFPEPTLDRGPVPYRRMSAFLAEKIAETGCLILVVFDQGHSYFSWLVKIAGGEAEMATTFDRWADYAGMQGFTGEDLDRAAERVAAEIGPVACGLFMSREDFESLFDGQPHGSLPDALILGGQAFGISNLPGLPEEAFLHTVGFFAYLPVLLF